MDKQHTPGPFSVDPTGDMGEHFFGSDEHGALGTFDEPFGKGSATGNARRAVAAWNATKGIPTEALEAGVVREMVDALELIASNGCYAVVPTADDHAEAGRYTLPERTAWFQGVARSALAKLRGDTDA